MGILQGSVNLNCDSRIRKISRQSYFLEIFLFDFSYINIFFDSFLLEAALNIDDPNKPQPMINNLLNIFKN